MRPSKYTDTLKGILGVKRHELNIVASPKGLVIGDLAFCSQDTETVSAKQVQRVARLISVSRQLRQDENRERSFPMQACMTSSSSDQT